MTIREAISEHPAISLAVMAAAVLAAIFYVAHALHGGAPTPASALGGQAFFTTNDGVTLFTDDSSKLPPFDHDGHEAVRAMVFTCDGGQHRWVQYLQKFTDDAKQQMQPGGGTDMALPSGLRARGASAGLLVKPPGAANWVSQTDFASFQGICQPKPPPGMGDGTPALLQP